MGSANVAGKWSRKICMYVIFMQDAQIKFLKGTLVFANHVNILVIPNSRSHTHVDTPMLHMPVLTYQRQLVLKQAKNYAIMAHLISLLSKLRWL